MGTSANSSHREPLNKGKIVGQKAPFKVKDIWALRVRLQMENRVRELALFNDEGKGRPTAARPAQGEPTAPAMGRPA